jgi:hypothetical protein
LFLGVLAEDSLLRQPVPPQAGNTANGPVDSAPRGETSEDATSARRDRRSTVSFADAAHRRSGEVNESSDRRTRSAGESS